MRQLFRSRKKFLLIDTNQLPGWKRSREDRNLNLLK